MSSPAVSLHQVVKAFGERLALDHLTLEFEPGQIFGFLGPNGAGKTTTIRLLLGSLRPDSGQLRVLGEEPSVRVRESRQRLGAVLEQAALYSRLTVEANLRFYGSLYPAVVTQGLGKRIEEVLSQVALSDRRKQVAGQLSLGMRKRLALARALLPNPELLLLDEPTSGLDPGSALSFRSLIQEFRDGGGTVFLTTHLMSEAEHLCDRVAIIDQGKLLCHGVPEDLMEEHLKNQEKPTLEKLFHHMTGTSS